MLSLLFPVFVSGQQNSSSGHLLRASFSQRLNHLFLVAGDHIIAASKVSLGIDPKLRPFFALDPWVEFRWPTGANLGTCPIRCLYLDTRMAGSCEMVLALVGDSTNDEL